jgi:hypothetical protein
MAGKTQLVPWTTSVQCQQICHWGHGKRWFEVGRVVNQDNDMPERDVGRKYQEDEAVDAEYKAAVELFNSIQEEDEKAFEDEASGRI